MRQTHFMTMKFISPIHPCSEWWNACDQKSRSVMTWQSGLQCHTGISRFILVHIWRHLLTLQIMSIKIWIWHGGVNHAKHSPYNKLALPVMAPQCNQLAIHRAHCTGSTRWRQHLPPWSDTMLSSIGMSPDGHAQMNAGWLGLWLKCLFIIENAESSVKGHLALVKTFDTVPIHQTPGMVMVAERHQPPMELLQDGSNCCKDYCGIRTCYLVCISTI